MAADELPLLVEQHETVNGVLAEQARSRPAPELWRTVIGGGVNALLLWTQFPSLHWLAGGFAAVTAYGLWGVLEHYRRDLESKNTQLADRRAARVLQLTFVVGGWSAALFAVGALMTSLVGGLALPGR